MQYTTKKNIVRFLHVFTWPFGLVSIIDYRLRKSEELFQFFSMLLSLMPGKIGQYVRASFYMQTLQESSYDFRVGFCSWVAHPNAIIGKSVVVGSFSIIGTATIENNVIISSRVSILSGKYQHGNSQDLEQLSEREQAYERVKIGSGTWLGEGSIVMADVGRNCIISSGSVVTKPMPENSTAVGNPARFLKLKVD